MASDTPITGSSVDSPKEQTPTLVSSVVYKDSTRCSRSDPTSAETERERHCTEMAEVHSTVEQNVDSTQTDPTNQQISPSAIDRKEDSPSEECETPSFPDPGGIDITPALHSEQVRNIIILGKIGAGKATIANEILGCPKFPVSTSVEGITRSTKKCTASGDRNGVKYNIKIIDTVGVTDTESEPRTQHILDEFKKFVDCEYGIHLIIFVFKNSRFTEEDRKVFSFITRTFKQVIEKISLLVITCCEGMSREARNDLVDDFENNETTKDIASVMHKGIVPVGFPNLQTVMVLLKPIYEETIGKDSEKLRKIVVENCTEKLSPNEFQKVYFSMQSDRPKSCVLF